MLRELLVSVTHLGPVAVLLPVTGRVVGVFRPPGFLPVPLFLSVCTRSHYPVPETRTYDLPRGVDPVSSCPGDLRLYMHTRLRSARYVTSLFLLRLFHNGLV